MFALAATTAVLSLDATVVLLTPVVLGAARTLRVKTRPHAYATVHLANTASLLLPVSNLTNLLAFSASGLSFTRFSMLMAGPWLAWWWSNISSSGSPSGPISPIGIPAIVRRQASRFRSLFWLSWRSLSLASP